jgi:hypothetical protein
MKRRTFIKTGIILAGLGLLSLLTIPSFKNTVIKMIQKDTAQLKLSQSSIEKFMKDANKEQFWVKFSRGKKILIVAFTYVGIFKSMLPFYNKYIQYRGQITGHFLLSTDFFMQRMDANQQVQYTQFYNPYKQACYNPFSSNFYPEKV